MSWFDVELPTGRVTSASIPTGRVIVPANPYLRCVKCGGRVEFWDESDHNQPCGHRAAYEDMCPSWGPVDGCQCEWHLGHVPHDPPHKPLTARGVDQGPE